MEVYFDYVNANGGIKDSTGKTRKLTLITKDDGYDSGPHDPPRRRADGLREGVHDVDGGSPSIMRIYDKMNQRCVPQPPRCTGPPGLGRPGQPSVDVRLILSYNTEAILWGTYIEQTCPRASRWPAMS